MNKSELKAIDRSMARLADGMSIYGLQTAIKDDWLNPQWGTQLFDLMNKTLERKMGKRAYSVWFNALPVEKRK